MKLLINKAEKYISEEGTTLQNACLECISGRSERHRVIEELSRYQNSDGGWSNGLEIEYPGPLSTPNTTIAALGYIFKFKLRESELFKNTISYLKNSQYSNGMWDDPKDIVKYPHPPYMGPGIYTEFKTGMILKWLIRLEVPEKEMRESALSYLLSIFNEVSLKNDFWSAVGYSNAFSLLPELAESSKIMQWCMDIIMPKEAQFGWQQAIGMIEDDIAIPSSLYNSVVEMIKSKQEADGGWPHLFGTYNRVWSAIHILRYLRNAGLIY